MRLVGGVEIGQHFGRQRQSTLRPRFEDLYWYPVPFDEELRVELRLIDGDDGFTGEDDPMGNVVIEYEQLVAAYRNGGKTAISVSDQGDGTIAFVIISVQAGDSRWLEKKMKRFLPI